MELAVDRGDEPVVADEATRRAGFGVVLHHEQVRARTVAAEECGRELGRRGRVARLPLGLHELPAHLVDRVVHGRREIRIVDEWVDALQRPREHGRAAFQLRPDLFDLVERESAVDDAQRFGIRGNRD